MAHQNTATILPIIIFGLFLLGAGVVVFFLLKKKADKNSGHVVSTDNNTPHPTEMGSDASPPPFVTLPLPSATSPVDGTSNVSSSTQQASAPVTGLSMLSALNAPHPVEKMQKNTVDSMGALEPRVAITPSDVPIRQVALGLTKPSAFNPLVQQSLPGIYQAGGFSGSAYYLQESPSQLNNLMQVVFKSEANTPLHELYGKKSQEIAARNRLLNQDNNFLNLVGENAEFNGTYFMVNNEKASLRPYDYQHSSQNKEIEEEIDREYEIKNAQYSKISTTPIFSQ